MPRKRSQNGSDAGSKLGEFWASHFLGAELSVSLFVTAGFGMWSKYIDKDHLVTKLLGTQRNVVYGTFVTLDGALLGFMIAATAIILGFAHSDKLKILRESPHYKTLWRTLKSTIRALGIATIMAIFALLVDRDGRTNLLFFVIWFGTTIFAWLRVCRSLWVLEKIIDAITSPD